MPEDTFPRRHAATQRFTLGAPRSVQVARDGSRVLYCRSAAGDDPVQALWCHETASGTDTLLADPSALTGAAERGLPEAERARRERAREGGGGIVSYATDADLTTVAFALGGRLFVTDVARASTVEVDVAGPVFDPRPSPDGTAVAYVTDRSLRVVTLADGHDRELVGPDGDADTVSWGSAEFVAAEEMGRQRGFWWAPDSTTLAVARVDVAPVPVWWIAAPVDPAEAPRAVRYPAAGSPNAEVRLFVVGLGGGRTEVGWDRTGRGYLADVSWDRGDPLTLVVQSRDQRTLDVLRADPSSGETAVVRTVTDEHWVELAPGVPAWSGGRLVTLEDRDGWRRVCLDGSPVTPVGLQVRAVVGDDGRSLVVEASEDPTETHLWWVHHDAGPTRLTGGAGVHHGRAAGGVVVRTSAMLDRVGSETVVIGFDGRAAPLRSHAETPPLEPHVRLLRAGPDGVRTALVLPRGAGDGPLPVLCDPYGGPHAQRVVAAASAYLVPQWFADAGFAVVVADGRGTPGRGAAWERAVAGDLAGPVLDDQVTALRAAAAAEPRLDLGRVAVRGWSFGGYLAALAVLRRPDVFHAAIAGAPVTDWALYDTHYTERYLGRPDDDAAAYRRTSLLEDAHRLERPLLLIHGLADDNVVAAHTLQLSRRLLETGRPHRVLPLSGVTHMTPQEEVAENLLRVQLAFLREALPSPGAE